MQYDYDLVFLGGLFPKEYEKNIIKNSKGVIQNAANIFQWNLVNGLDKNLVNSVKIINSVYVGSFPFKYKKMFIKSFEFQHNLTSKINDINVGFINLFGIKHLSRYLSLKTPLKKWASDNKPNKVVICYALTIEFILCMQYLKRINPEIITCVVVPDLPQFMNTGNKKSFIYNKLKNIEIKQIKKRLSFVDCFVLLTEYMVDYFSDFKRNYVVVEGIATDYFRNIQCEKNNKLKIILYSGTLNQKYGVVNLVEAFKLIDNENFRLILCGEGDSTKYIIEESKKDNRIIFKGQLKRDDVLKLQKQATVLINPRQNNNEFTKYSFPSKILEYLSSGTPVIAYKLDGIPKEYDEFFFYIKDNSIESLSMTIKEVCKMSENDLLDKGKKALEFVSKNKNDIVQSKKILDMIFNTKIISNK